MSTARRGRGRRFEAFVGGRAAEAFESAATPGVWRVLFELHPQHTDPKSDWHGGQLSLEHGWDAGEATEIARSWVNDGERPAGIADADQRRRQDEVNTR